MASDNISELSKSGLSALSDQPALLLLLSAPANSLGQRVMGVLGQSVACSNFKEHCKECKEAVGHVNQRTHTQEFDLYLCTGHGLCRLLDGCSGYRL